MNKKLEISVPVLFLVFNRLEETKMVFAQIRKAKPKKLYIASDGPRKDKLGESEIIHNIRKFILSNITWPCKVKTLFREKNLGCKYGVSSAIDWFFKNEEMGIILEDDCMPNQSFFKFCQEMLIKYKDDTRIAQISGTNVEKISKVKESYFFSDCFNAWGWATWKRAWDKYDINMKNWKKIRFSFRFFNLVKGYPFHIKINSWRIYQLTYNNKIDTWDYQWIFSCIYNNEICIIPKKNLITNIGFKSNATHTSNYSKKDKKLKNFNLNVNNNSGVKEDISKDYRNSYVSFFRK
jgi:hypothetical protein